MFFKINFSFSFFTSKDYNFSFFQCTNFYFSFSFFTSKDYNFSFSLGFSNLLTSILVLVLVF